ncbi:hypothetical protein [Photobacterium halotolerans]|uniref:hypothetical protein n=1 Tax=Photobacterium halotolerans TaxID=265726 RepID=UPI000481C856|nr:hypothetical protein [Photobacterium halotolerans]
MNKKNQRSDDIQNDAPTSPKALLESITASALVSLGKFAYDASKDTYVALKPDKPLVVTIEDSVTSDSNHRVMATIANFGAHSVYLESFEIRDPDGTNFRIQIVKRDQETMDISQLGQGRSTQEDVEDRPMAFKPIRLLANEFARIRIDINLLSRDRLEKKPFVTLRCNYTVLGVASKPKQHDFGIAIRECD